MLHLRVPTFFLLTRRSQFNASGGGCPAGWKDPSDAWEIGSWILPTNDGGGGSCHPLSIMQPDGGLPSHHDLSQLGHHSKKKRGKWEGDHFSRNL